MAVAEGTETALAFLGLYGVPCWSTLGTGGLRRFEPPGLQRLIIAADNDADGLGHPRTSSPSVPQPLPGSHLGLAHAGDWNDVVRAEAA